MEKNFYKIIEQILRDLNISQTAFAKEIGVKQSTVSKWISGVQIPTFDSLRKICIAFNVDGNEVLGLD